MGGKTEKRKVNEKATVTVSDVPLLHNPSLDRVAEAFGGINIKVSHVTVQQYADKLAKEK